MTHTILNFITTVDPAKLEPLTALLAEIEDDLSGNPHLPFSCLKRLHFGSLTILEDTGDEHGRKNFAPYLVFEHNFDGTLEPYLEELLDCAAPGLDRIYSHCLEYPASGLRERATLRAFLISRVVRPHAYHIGNVGRSVGRVQQEAALREQIEGHLDALVLKGQAQAPPATIRRGIQEFVRSLAPDWTQTVAPRMTFTERFVPWVKLVAAAFLVLLLALVLFPLFIIYLIALRRRERTDPANIPPLDPAHVLGLAAREDHIVQNHMANLRYVKPGSLRRLTIRFVLLAVNLVARVSTHGQLVGLRSLHFAHWVVIDDGRRLLFLTNYDGSWENYLDDFIDRIAIGLTAIWSNTINFPRSRFLLFGGAKDGARFKATARQTQFYTNVWYSAYPRLTVQAVDNNSAIREDLFTPLGEAQTRAWLRRF
ncbi:MAG TPA: hypothetical protein VGB76_10250 [Pyrinomonadaceae bacterium]|jgi:hypothetical protein